MVRLLSLSLRIISTKWSLNMTCWQYYCQSPEDWEKKSEWWLVVMREQSVQNCSELFSDRKLGGPPAMERDNLWEQISPSTAQYHTTIIHTHIRIQSWPIQTTKHTLLFILSIKVSINKYSLSRKISHITIFTFYDLKACAYKQTSAVTISNARWTHHQVSE